MTFRTFNHEIFNDRYAAFKGETWEQLARRVAHYAARAELTEENKKIWENVFYKAIKEQKLIPAGRILRSAGSSRKLSAFNCFVLPSPEDSRHGIIDTLKNMVEIMANGGGVGINISSLRPKSHPVYGVDGKSSGSVSWGELYSFATGLVEQGGSRRGALMLTLHIDHPDILEFISVKRDMQRANNANLSVLVTDAFMRAVREDVMWEFRFPDTQHENYKNWDGDFDVYPGPFNIYSTIKARDLWYQIAENAHASAEPGVIFWDTVQKGNPLSYAVRFASVNPCQEKPLPANGVCNLASLNLANLEEKDIGEYTKIAVRFLDNIVNVGYAVLDEVEETNLRDRRIGVGVLGLHTFLLQRDIPYNAAAKEFVWYLFKNMYNAALEASCTLAEEKGSFDTFDAKAFLSTPFARSRLSDKQKEMIKSKGLRNAELLSVAPTGTIATMLGESTGIEPFFTLAPYVRHSRIGDIVVEGHPDYEENNPLYFGAQEIRVSDHLEILAAAAYWVDASISKTVNLAEDATVKAVQAVYEYAHKHRIKGVTVYRDKSRNQQVLENVLTCSECGGIMIAESGCHTCRDCGFSFCSV